jgi:lon-related putative ATP-dependent protease
MVVTPAVPEVVPPEPTIRTSAERGSKAEAAPTAPPERTDRALSPALLRRACDAATLPFESTAELEPLDAPLGQARAVEAIALAVAMNAPGYNVFAVGPTGVGKHAVIQRLLLAAADERAAPCDYCYVHNFSKPHEPMALALPHGRGTELARDMQALLQDLRAAVPAALETDDYRTQMQKIERELKEHSENVLRGVGAEAAKRGLALLRADEGIGFAPMREGRILSQREFDALADEEQAALKKDIGALHELLHERMNELPHWAQVARDELRELNRKVTEQAVRHAMAGIEARYHDLPEVMRYLTALRDDVVDNAGDFHEGGASKLMADLTEQRPFVRYSVNLLVDHAASHRAPVVYVDEPSVEELLGRIEHRVWLGNTVSDFTLLKAGALHRANGGFLVVDAYKIVRMPYAWDAFKRALFSKHIRYEPLGRMLGLSSISGIEPEPIPLDVKVVLIGDRSIYGILTQLDPEVSELFKVVAEFDDRITRDDEGERAYARWLAAIAESGGLRAFDRYAVARLIEEGSRIARDSLKLSTSVREISTLMQTADHHAATRGSEMVSAGDVDHAIDERIRLRNLLKERVQEAIIRDMLRIETEGSRIGQVNGLSVLELGDYAFGRPTRITATVRLGSGKVVDIEREVELGGPVHSKGVLILSSYLAARYARAVPWSMSASLVFEQSYAGVEGDSASLAELCALISAIAGVPIRQDLAVTGSVNQLGQVQPVGGVDEKIEGFFDVCKSRGLSGAQGVIIPATNRENLMLRREVVDACQDKRFHVYPVDDVDRALELLTGLPAGASDESGVFPEGTLNARVVEQLLEFAVTAEHFSKLVELEEPEEETQH